MSRRSTLEQLWRGRQTLHGSIPLNNANNGAFLFGFNAGGVEVGILLEALESRGVVRTLAEPNLTALSGQEAKFLAGGEYPDPVSQDNGAITIEYKPFGVELNFTPRVIDNDMINLELSAAVSSIDSTTALPPTALPSTPSSAAKHQQLLKCATAKALRLRACCKTTLWI